MITQNKIKLQLEFFAILRDLLTEKLVIEIPENSTVFQLREYLTKEYPQIKEILEYSRFANENEILDNQATLKENQKIYILPPSSGG